MNKYIYNNMHNKQKLSLLFATAVIALTFTSCIDYNDVTEAVNVDVQLVMPTEFTTSDFANHTITLSQISGSTTMQATSDENGVAHFTGIVPDQYTVSTSWNLTSDEYKTYTGDDQVTDGAVVSGSLSNTLIGADAQTTTLQLSTQLSINRSLVISKVYYAGTKNDNNRNYTADQYIELYNQSDDTVNVAGLCIGLVESDSRAWTATYLSEQHPDSTALKQVFRFPDTEKLVAPGGSVVVANSAIDHSSNGSSESPNLLDADYDVNDTRTRNAYTNNPAVPDMDVLYTFSASLNYMNLVNGGPTSLVIFRATSDEVASWPLIYSYGRTTGSEYKLMPNSVVIDAVEILKYSNRGSVDIDTKRFVNSLDAGYTNITSVSGYNGEVVVRKISTRTGNDGHKILTDTNNSTSDFEVSTTVKPRDYSY